jgi:uncharacterized cupredoxin-like copper-binding protein
VLERKESCPVRILVLAAVLIIGGLAFACGDDEKPPAATGSPRGNSTAGGTGGGTQIDVTVQEFSVIPVEDSAEAGEITFNVNNVGPEDVHEFVVVKTGLKPEALPTKPDGSMDESGEGVEVIDELEEIAVDESRTLTVDLEAGSYVLICNIFDETENEAHYQEGMHTAFTVQ